MAKMIPALLPRDTTSAAERTLFYALQNGLDRDIVVLHSLGWLDDHGPCLREGECDFVVLHPRAGLLAVEAKSGAPSYVGREDRWEYDDGRTLKDPFDQAARAAHALNDLLKRGSRAWDAAGPTFGHLVAMPDASRVTGNLGPHMKPELLMLEPDLEQVQRRVEGALAAFGSQDPWPAGMLDEVLDILRPSFRLVPSLRAELAVQERELVRLTDMQSLVLDAMDTKNRLVVRGGAGTGKTLLARERAARMAADGRDVLMLCYNNSLEAHLKASMSELADRVTVRTFHGLCMDIVQHGHPEGKDFGPGTDGGQEFWTETLPQLAADYAGAWPHRYDAVLVDEAQDFLEGWWVVPEDLLRDESSRYILFCDPRQDVYRRGCPLPFHEPSVDLPLNCRNTGPIARWVHEFAGLPLPDTTRLPDGREPSLHEVADADAEVEAVRKVLHDLIQNEKVEPARIMILGKHTFKRSPFVDRPKLGNVTVRDAWTEPAPMSVGYATVQKFKGLEADCVLLVGVGEPSRHFTEQDEKTLAHVGGSRARSLLHVFIRPGGET